MSDVLDRLRAALADRYALERELGSGGMAVVYLAEDLRHERRVAVKVWPHVERSDPSAQQGPVTAANSAHRDFHIVLDWTRLLRSERSGTVYSSIIGKTLFAVHSVT